MAGAEEFRGTIGNTYKDSDPWWLEPPAAPSGAPDIVIIVLDDVGFSDLGCYGSEVSTPRIDALAAGGLRYSNFHVTALCSPTRACLLTGRNAHSVGVGIISEWSGGFPGYQGRITHRAAVIPELLREREYATYAIGKWHLTNIADYGAGASHADWPLGRGFDRWYGFHGALADQWNPELYQDNRPIPPPPRAGYHLSEDLVDRAIADIRDHVVSAPQRPMFLYLAFGACHWPHHVPRELIDRQRGVYDVGWDAIREERLARQTALGIVPPDTRLSPRNPGIEAWHDLAPNFRIISARFQETYAAFLEHTDLQIGRLVDYLKSVGRLDNTLIILLSDNGASAEGGASGAVAMRKHMVYEKEQRETVLAQLDLVGGPDAFNHYPVGWAQVSNTPLKWYKKGNHGGGIRSPLIVHWPARIGDPGAIRPQYHHVVDLAPTLYDILDIRAPEVHRGIPQLPIHGTSIAYTLDDATAPTRKTIQYYEVLGDRAIWQGGWKAVARHPKGSTFDEDHWELYHLEADYAELDDLAAKQPERLQALVCLWWSEARKYDVLPLDDRDLERTARTLGMKTTTRFEYLGGMSWVDRLAGPDITGRSYAITASFTCVDGEARGVLLAWGSRFGGFVLFADDGTICYEYVYSLEKHYSIRAPFAPQTGSNEVRIDFHAGPNRSAVAALSANGRPLGSVEIPHTWPTYGTTAGVNCGRDMVAISKVYEAPFEFNADSLRVVMEVESAAAAAGEAFRAVLKEQ